MLRYHILDYLLDGSTCDFDIFPKISESRYIKSKIDVISRQRPYHIEHTSSRPITEVKQC